MAISNFLYYGLFLDQLSADVLKEVAKKFDFQEPFILDHITLLYKLKDNMDLYKTLEMLNTTNTNYWVTVDAIGWNNKAVAFKVCDVSSICANKIPHITICTRNGGKPVDSNTITNWYTIEPIKINVHLIKIMK